MLATTNGSSSLERVLCVPAVGTLRAAQSGCLARPTGIGLCACTG